MTPLEQQRFERLSARVDEHDSDVRDLKEAISNRIVEVVTRLDRIETDVHEIHGRVCGVEENSKTMEVRALRAQLRKTESGQKRWRRYIWAVAGVGSTVALEHLLPLVLKLLTGGH